MPSNQKNLNTMKISRTQNEIVIGKEIFLSIKKQNPKIYYDIDSKELGKGAFGTVYKGRAIGTEGAWRAIKKIDRKAVANQQMLINQIEILVTLDHPTVIKLYDIFEWKNSVYLVTDLCVGGQLFDKLEEVGTFCQETARIIFRQIIEGINYIHHKKIAHRDLKPENFMFLNRDSLNLKFIDFGLAYRWEKDMRKELRRKGQRKLVGTSYYLSPQVASFQYDQRCDIWSAGVILYMLVTGIPPFEGENDNKIIRNVKQLQYTMDIPQFNGISQELKDLIEQILVPADERISVQEIFNHPWMKIDVPICPLTINFHKMAAFTEFSKLKKLTTIYVASQCAEKQVEKLGEIFKQIDKDKNGTISIEQLKNALELEAGDSSLHKLKELMDSIDTDKDGTINYTEFLASIIDKEQIFSEINLKSMFNKLDLDGNGVVQKQQLKALFEKNGVQQYNGRSLKEIMDSCDQDHDGEITFQEFKAAIIA